MNYTSIEQSKKLLELGLSPESADMFYEYVDEDHWRNIPECAPIMDGDLPCWSVGALMQLIPHTDLWGLSLNNYSGAKLVWTAVFEWKDRKSPMVLEDNILDAVYRIVVWLLENNYIKQ